MDTNILTAKSKEESACIMESASDEINFNLAPDLKEKLIITPEQRKKLIIAPLIRPSKFSVTMKGAKKSEKRKLHENEGNETGKRRKCLSVSELKSCTAEHLIDKFITLKISTGRLPRLDGYKKNVFSVFYPYLHDMIIPPLQKKTIKSGLHLNTQGSEYTTIMGTAPNIAKQHGLLITTLLDNNFNGSICFHIFNSHHNKPIIIKQHDIIAEISFIKTM